jgi:hypothetical protein
VGERHQHHQPPQPAGEEADADEDLPDRRETDERVDRDERGHRGAHEVLGRRHPRDDLQDAKPQEQDAEGDAQPSK